MTPYQNRIKYLKPNQCGELKKGIEFYEKKIKKKSMIGFREKKREVNRGRKRENIAEDIVTEYKIMK